MLPKIFKDGFHHSLQQRAGGAESGSNSQAPLLLLVCLDHSRLPDQKEDSRRATDADQEEGIGICEEIGEVFQEEEARTVSKFVAEGVWLGKG